MQFVSCSSMFVLFSTLLFLICALSQAQEIIYFQAANTSIFRDVKNGLHFANFFQHQSKYLNVTPFMSLLVPNKKKCQVWCVKDLRCLSFNIAVLPNSDGQFECELLVTDMFNSSTNMTDNVNYHHYSIKAGGCYPSPCKNNGTCLPKYKTNTYSCLCQCPYHGDECEKVLPTIWNSWSNCSYNLTCPNITRTRTKTYAPHTYAQANVCPKNMVVATEIQNCPSSSSIGCDSPVGMQDGRILDSQITASSTYVRSDLNQSYYAPWKGRLHKVPQNDCACWSAKSLRIGEYLQVDLGVVMNITKVATQGRGLMTVDEHVTKYSLQYSTDNTAWKDYYDNECIKELSANTDQTTVVTNALPVPITARYVRIVVKEFYNHPTMRAELYGC